MHKKFPDGFPDEFKFCCNCQNMALGMVRSDFAIGFYYINQKTASKILERITLVR